MADNTSALAALARHLGEALHPLEQDLASGNVIQLFAELGLHFPPALLTPGFTGALSNGAAAAGKLPDLLADLTTAITNGNEGDIVTATVGIIEQVVKLVTAIEQIGNQLSTMSPATLGVSAGELSDFASHLPGALFGYAIVSYLERVAPGAVGVANLIGVVDYVREPGVPGDAKHPPHVLKQLELSRLGDLFSSPSHLLSTLYDWGVPNSDGTKLMKRLSPSLDLLGLASRLSAANDKLDTTLVTFETVKAGPKTGVAATLQYPLLTGFDLTIPLSAMWSATMGAHGAFTPGLKATIMPPATATVKPTGTLDGALTLAVVAHGPDANHPIVLAGQPGGSVLQTDSFSLGTGLTFTWDAGSNTAHVDPSVQIAVKGGKAVIDLSSGDGFIATLVGSGGRIESSLDFKIVWTPAKGAAFEGSSSIEIGIPTHVSLGPLEIEKIYIKVGIGAGGSLPAELSTAFTANLGPLAASVDRIGLTLTTTFPEHGGNLGPANVAVAFKPPNGVGLSVDAGVVKGGGFLYIDTDRGEYAGALELVFADFLSLHAIGLINTKMPDGSAGFSLLIIITAEFGSGIQLGFGFTLLGVGGLLGLNREMRMQPLMEGVRTGSIESIMFPHDVVANAQRIISDLRAIFPPKEGTFLIGPMAKIGWGTPTLISLALGVIIEIPPGNIAILGVLRLALPADDVALIVIQVNFAGALEFDKKRFYFFASLFDSRVLFITIEGEMGVLMAFGDDANFVVSVGGFHPQFSPPPLPFPSPRRIEVDILNEDWARIRVTGYFAVTSNSVQFGAHAELYFGFSALNVQGEIGFDALIQFSPFHFIVSVEASLSVKVFGIGFFSIDLSLSLEGPSAWHAHGTASISILFFSVDVSIDVSWGEAKDTTLPPISVMPILTGELGKQANWRAVLPAGSNLLVSLRQLDPAEADFVLHPVGTLHFSQRAIPLDLTLDKVGNQKPEDANFFKLAVSAGGLVAAQTLREQFAPAQFKSFDDAARLSQQAYAPLDSGLVLAADGHAYASGTAVTRIVRYDLTILDTTLQPKRSRFRMFNGALFAHFLRGASVARSDLSAFRKAQTDPFDAKVTVSSETFVVAHQSNNAAYAPEATAFASQAAANDYLARTVAADPSLHGQLHVLPQFEVAA